ncbi:hypothetical protein K7A42_01865 [Agrobacterium sp. InxBP2]|uniref:hypothetical protein n=1 Tax=unclassified Agrobacterium TaxID=2632611 RepID=UPI000ADD96FD|nr:MULTISPECIES: hypothetical protein [unclassified Agrobacterium]MCW8279624.1 hypothetical protein [Agrobacterium sp. InxBP2]
MGGGWLLWPGAIDNASTWQLAICEETTAFRQLKAIRELCETHDAFALAHPSKQPDAEI